MSQQQAIVKGDTVQRLGSLGFIIGGVLLFVIAALDILRDGGGTTQRVVAGFFVPVGIWGVMMGTAAIYRSITAAGAEWARLGIFFLGIGMVRSTVFPKGLGWTGFLLGILALALGGVPLFFLGEGSFGEVLGPILAGLTTLWVLVMGVWVARRAW